MKNLSTSIVLLAFPFISIAQTAGTLDSSFATNGIYSKDFGAQDNLTCVGVQAGQKVVSAGTALSPAFAGQLLVIRQNEDGSLDPSFNDSGIVLLTNFTESYAYAVQTRSDQKLLVAGTAADANYAFSGLVLRFNPDGSLDQSFGQNGISTFRLAGDTYFNGMQILANNKIVVAGTAVDTAFNNQPIVMRLNEDGSLDSSFGLDGVASVPVTEIDNKFNKISVQSDGKIVTAGHYGNPITIDGQTDFDILIARFTADGQLDASFSDDGILIDQVSPSYIDDIFGLGINSEGKIIVAGYATLADFSYDAIVLQYNSDGSRDLGFADNFMYRYSNAAQDVFLDLTVQDNDEILVAGTTGGFFFDNRDFVLVRLKENGNLDNDFGTAGIVITEVYGFVDEINALCLDADERILVAGKANNGQQNDACVARYNGKDDASGLDESAYNPFQLYPNPLSKGMDLNIKALGLSSIQKVALFDALGRELSNEWQLHGTSLSLSNNLLQTGLNFVQLMDAEGNYYRFKVVKE